MDILLNGEHDVVFNNDSPSVTTNVQEDVAQRLKIKLKTFQGEFYPNTSYGVDYFGRVFGKNRRRGTIDIVYQEQILSEPDVLEIVEYSSELSNEREYSATFRVRTPSGFTSPITIGSIL